MRKRALMLLPVLLAVGCSTPDGSQTARPTTTTEASPGAASSSPRSEVPIATPPPSAPGTGSAPSLVTMAFAGDIHFEGAARPLLSAPQPLVTSLRDTVGAADFAVANLETSIGAGGRPMPGKQYTFRAPPAALKVLAAAGFDAISMANNHAVDFGGDVLTQTLDAKQSSPIPITGVGKNLADAFAPVEVRLGSARVAVLASSQVRDLTGLHHAATEQSAGIAANIDPTRLVAAVRSSTASHDIVVVVMHWGTEQDLCADERQRQTAADLLDAGADIIVGGHGHRPQGSGWLGGSYVAFGLGNFVWYQNVGGNGDSGVLLLTVDTTYAAATTRSADRGSARPRGGSVVKAARWVPMRIGADGVPRRSSSDAARTASESWARSGRCGSLSPRGPAPS